METKQKTTKSVTIKKNLKNEITCCPRQKIISWNKYIIKGWIVASPEEFSLVKRVKICQKRQKWADSNI